MKPSTVLFRQAALTRILENARRPGVDQVDTSKYDGYDVDGLVESFTSEIIFRADIAKANFGKGGWYCPACGLRSPGLTTDDLDAGSHEELKCAHTIRLYEVHLMRMATMGSDDQRLTYYIENLPKESR
jgi:hypothetical protein